MSQKPIPCQSRERHEYFAYKESFAVLIELRETPDEDQTVDEALAFIDELESRSNEGLQKPQCCKRVFMPIYFHKAAMRLSIMWSLLRRKSEVSAGNVQAVAS
ncbi:MAG: hypothetical protein GW907_13510 [Betaproteobacteria bacterium]|nr:hypothetical protein [Betaproteobacteria bacterium]